MAVTADYQARAARADDEALERRLTRSMCVAVAVAVCVCAALAPWRVTTGLALGGVLSLVNHHWLRSSIAAAFGGDLSAQRPRLKVARYVLRYFVVGLVVFAAARLDLISVAAALAGLCSFVVALFVEAARQFYIAIVHREET
jgi:ATP synthase I chain